MKTMKSLNGFLKLLKIGVFIWLLFQYKDAIFPKEPKPEIPYRDYDAEKVDKKPDFPSGHPGPAKYTPLDETKHNPNDPQYDDHYHNYTDDNYWSGYFD